MLMRGAEVSIDWELRAKGLLKAEIKRKNLTYGQLCEKLAEIGVFENPRSVANKISRGRFSVVFFTQCLTAIGCTELQIKF